MPPIPPVTYAILVCFVPMIPPALSLQHVFSRRIAENAVTFCRVAGLERRRSLRSGMCREPFLPPWPPGALMQRGLIQPLHSLASRRRILPGQLAETAPRMHRTADDAGVVSAVRQDISVVGGPRQLPRLEGRHPRRNMIGLGAQPYHRQRNGLQGNRLPPTFEASIGKVVLQVQLLQVFAVLAPRHTPPFPLPRHQHLHLLPLTLH